MAVFPVVDVLMKLLPEPNLGSDPLQWAWTLGNVWMVLMASPLFPQASRGRKWTNQLLRLSLTPSGSKTKRLQQQQQPAIVSLPDISATMSSVQHLRDFIRERLTAAAEEIFTEVEKTIVRYEEDIKLLEIHWKPQIKLTRIDVPQQHEDEEEEVFTEQLCNQMVSWNENQEQSEPPHDSDSNEELGLQLLKEEPGAPGVKEERQEVCCSQQGQSLCFTQTVTLQQTDFSEEEPNFEHLDSNSVCALENQDEAGSCSPVLASRSRMAPNESCRCHVCGKFFQSRYNTLRHIRVHSGEKPFSCKICGKFFRQKSHLKEHMKRHTGIKPFSCETCGRCFSRHSNLQVHRKTHTRSGFIPCETCGKSFGERCYVRFHMQPHTCERPYSCVKCEASFSSVSKLTGHQRVHRARRDVQ